MAGKSNIEIRAIQSWRAAGIRELYEAAGWWHADGDEAEIAPLILGSFCFAVALVDERLVGMGRVLSDGVSDAYIQDVVVLPEFRGRHVGADIIRFLVEQCSKAGLTWIGLVAEPGTVPFYERLDFVPLEGHTPMRYRRKD